MGASGESSTKSIIITQINNLLSHICLIVHCHDDDGNNADSNNTSVTMSQPNYKLLLIVMIFICFESHNTALLSLLLSSSRSVLCRMEVQNITELVI